VVCPWLARPNARRRWDADVVGLRMRRGDPRGALGEIGGAVVSFQTYEFTAKDRVEFRFRGLVDFLPHLMGEEHLPALRDATAHEEHPGVTCPTWLMQDEESARARAERYA